MPILHTINQQLQVVLSSWIGEISDADLLPSYRRLYENGQWQPGFNEIADLRNAKMNAVTGDGLYRLASMVMEYTEGKCDSFKTAIIAPTDLPFGVARMYEAYADSSPESVQVFRNLKDAIEWIGIEERLIEQLDESDAVHS